jgi:hypothetical protein
MQDKPGGEFMNISFVGDDSIMFDGVPKNVIVQVTFGNEKTTFPYPAKKTIAALFADVNKIDGKPIKFDTGIPAIKRETTKFIPNANEICREDVVRCVKVNERDVGIDADKIPVVGNEYRIIQIHRKNGVAHYYEVINDKSELPIRMAMFTDEIELLRKHIPQEKKTVLSEIVKCPCGEEVAIDLIGDTYSGACPNCGCALSKERVKQ